MEPNRALPTEQDVQLAALYIEDGTPIRDIVGMFGNKLVGWDATYYAARRVLHAESMYGWNTQHPRYTELRNYFKL